MLANKRYVHT